MKKQYYRFKMEAVLSKKKTINKRRELDNAGGL